VDLLNRAQGEINAAKQAADKPPKPAKPPKAKSPNPHH
jgi:hypothetical protein